MHRVCGKMICPGPNARVCVADEGHEGKHNFWPEECVAFEATSITSDELLKKAVASRGTPENIEEWARTLAEATSKLDD